MLKLLLLGSLIALHPIHVSLTSIDQVQGSDTLTLFFRMYYDDFLRDYKIYDPAPDFEKISEGRMVPDDAVGRYFNDRVRIYINRRLLPGKLVSVSNDNFEITLKLRYDSDTDPKQFRIRNQILTRLYSDQTNMVFIKINRYEDAMRLTSSHTAESRNLK